MKCIIILTIIACVLSVTLASNYHHKVDKAHSEVMSYVQENIRNVPMMRGLTYHLECFNGFLPLINSLATRARDLSNGCVSIAKFEKDQELLALQNARKTTAAEVAQITSSLTDCSTKDGLDYFLCLQDNADANRKLMKIIKNNSKDLMTKYAENAKEIDRKEQACIMKAVDNAKAESDQAFVDLKSCIRDGPIIQTQIDGEEEGTTTQRHLDEVTESNEQ